MTQTYPNLGKRTNTAKVDVIKSILPEELHDEIPSGFNTVGHVGKSKSVSRRQVMSCLTPA